MIGPTGHRIVYGRHGRRILCIDPSGTILHECQWSTNADGTVSLSRARVRLDSLLWIGIIPEATVQETSLDLPWRDSAPTVSARALREMAARVWNVPLEDVRYFYPDGGFAWRPDGSVGIRLKKDGLFLLEDGTFVNPQFISYMGAMPWERIDLLNVVELYQSTLPGTGSAVLELIWGLCEDQRRAFGAIPLRYRGLPTYPSEQAYGLFRAFFRAETPNGQDPYALFMDRHRANTIAWWLRDDPPWRYFDRAQQLCVTVQAGFLRKVTAAADSTAVSYVAPDSHGGFASCARTVRAMADHAQLMDGEHRQEVPLDPSWGRIGETGQAPPACFPFDWRHFFGGHPLAVEPRRAFALALLYPDDETEVGELPSQPFVLEQVYASVNGHAKLAEKMGRASRLLVDGFDAVAAGCIDDELFRENTVLYRSPEWAQKQAQLLWDRAARAGRLSVLRKTWFLARAQADADRDRPEYDLILCWIPFAAYDHPTEAGRLLGSVGKALVPGGLAVVAGPLALQPIFTSAGLDLRDIRSAPVLERLPLLVEHKRLLPRTRLRSSLTVFCAEKA